MVVEIHRPVVVSEDANRGEVVDRHPEEPVHLGSVESHRQHASHPRGLEQVGNQATPDRDAGCVLFVGPGVGIVRHDRRDRGGRRSSSRVDHEQQLHEVLLRWRDERLDDVDVALPAIGQELGLEAVVAEATDVHPGQAHAQVRANPLRECGMCIPRKHDDVRHVVPSRMRDWPPGATLDQARGRADEGTPATVSHITGVCRTAGDRWRPVTCPLGIALAATPGGAAIRWPVRA